MIVSLANMDSIPSECEALDLVVFSNIVNFIIYDIIVTAFHIIFSIWLYNYYCYTLQ